MTKSARIIALAETGTRPSRIAADTGIALTTVYTVISKARRAGHPIPEFPRIPNTDTPTQELRFTLDCDTAQILQREATARGTTPGRLAKQLIDVIAEDKMFRAVLE